jgi:hypothetical protein
MESPEKILLQEPSAKLSRERERRKNTFHIRHLNNDKNHSALSLTCEI